MTDLSLVFEFCSRSPHCSHSRVLDLRSDGGWSLDIAILEPLALNIHVPGKTASSTRTLSGSLLCAQTLRYEVEHQANSEVGL